MSTKLIIVFSIVTAVLVAMNTGITIRQDSKALMEREQETLTVLAERMTAEIERDITVMEYGIGEMLQDGEFMAALDVIHTLGEEGENTPEYRKAQNLLSSKLYQQPLNDNFYSVNVLTPEGFILTSHFQKFEVIEPYSDEVKTQFSRMPWLTDNTFNLSTMQVITPHPDPWDIYQSTAKSVRVYSVAVMANYHGKKIGYLEVNIREEELEHIFHVPNMTGFQAAAIFENRPQERLRNLYCADDNTILYENVIPGQMTVCKDQNGVEYSVVSAENKWLGLTVYAAQDMSVFYASMRSLIQHHIQIGLIILTAAIAVIMLFSHTLTRSITQLNQKITGTNSQALLTENIPFPDRIRKVTSRYDKEVRALENSFDDLIISLQSATRTEMELREATLRAQLNALQAQINPHFIYNTLNILSAKFMEVGAEDVIDICDQFAQMLRYSTDLRSNTATLREEIDHVRNYLMLSKARYEDKLTYEINVPPSFMELVMPKLALQPMVENAISHGYQHSKGSIHIRIDGSIDEAGRMHLIMQDNGAGFDETVLRHLQDEFSRIENGEFSTPGNTTAHIGLVNTYRRLYFFSERSIRMTLRNEGGAVVELIINKIKESI